VVPGNTAEQWQDELDQKFNLPFEILANEKLEASRSGNWFAENELVIARLSGIQCSSTRRTNFLPPIAQAVK